MAETLTLQIVTPQATVFSERVSMVTLPVLDGQIGVYPQHVRLITMIVPGEVVASMAGEDRFLAVGEGLAEIAGDHVLIVTDMAIPADQIDEAKVEEARARAAARLQRKNLRRRGRDRQCVSGSLAGAAAGAAAAPQRNLSNGESTEEAGLWMR